ncbi:MAG: alpha/beta hydrolase [Caulobacterales bacterium]|nr:alpha/beta hydrolase [Caulobacterales bacterium]
MMRALHATAAAVAFVLAAATPAAAQSRSLADVSDMARAVGEDDPNATVAAARALLALDAAALTPPERRGLQARLADALADMGELGEAIAIYSELLAEAEAEFGPEALELAPLLTRLAELQATAGDFVAADALNDRAIAISEAVLAEDHPALASLLETRAAIAELRLAELETELAEAEPSAPVYDGEAGSDDMVLGDERNIAVLAPDPARELRERVAESRARREALEEATGEEAEDRADLGGERSLTRGGSESADKQGFQIVPVFYGTSRKPTKRKDPMRFYGGQRSQDAGERLQTGIAVVSVPNNRELGSIPQPSIWRGEFRRVPERHVILRNVRPFEGVDQFAAELRRTMDASDRREAFIYIHGFNNDFATATMRTAQLAVDLELDGAPILYSWPSRGDVLSYFADSATVVRPVVDDLKAFLTLVAEAADADRLHLVAHSMGNRYLIDALEQVVSEREPDAGPIFDEVVFAAPDVDASDFEARLPGVKTLAESLTLYASDDDRALEISRLMNGGYPRAGDASELTVVADLDTVDTTEAPTPLLDLGHEDVFQHALADFRAVVWFSLEPQSRCILDELGEGAGRAWSYSEPNEERCSSDIFSAAILTLRRLGPERTMQLLDAQIDLTTGARDDASADRWRAVRDIVEGIVSEPR